MKLADIIKEILIEQSAVVLPGIGKIYMVRKPASVDAVSKSLKPPASEIHFTASAANEKSTMADFIARHYSVPVIKAEREVQLAVKNIQASLDKGEKVLLQDIGSLQKSGSEIIFVSSSKPQASPDSLGLKEIPLPASKPVTKIVSSPAPTEKNIEYERRKAAIIVSSILLFLLIIIVLIANTNSQPEPAPPVVVTPPPPPPPIVENNYYLVTGSFVNLANAEQFAALMVKTGYNAVVMSDSVLYRITIMNTMSRDSAVEELNKLRAAKGEDFVWMLTK